MTDVDRIADVDDALDEPHLRALPGDYPCFRCGESLDENHWVDLSARHQGPLGGSFEDATRAFCPDCVAAVGLLDDGIE